MRNRKIGIIYGTRPEIIKLAPIIRECQSRGIPFFCIHSGQHYSFELDKVFFDELSLPKPDYHLSIGIKSTSGHGEQSGIMMNEIEKILIEERPSIVIVQGDTNTVLAGALVASKIPVINGEQCIRVAHVEAGLRSYDRRMPEEINRIIVDHISDYLFVPTIREKEILLNEGISNNKIYVVGNTIVDMVNQSSNIANNKSTILNKLGINKFEYLLLTLHRQENVDSREILQNIINGVCEFSKQSNLIIIFPVHPRTKKKLENFKIELPKNIVMIDPVGYLDFTSLEMNSKLILTDSGGVQEESCIMKVPCITLRDNTERPETVTVGANMITGTISQNIINGASKMVLLERNWQNPFGDGESSKKIIDILLK